MPKGILAKVGKQLQLYIKLFSYNLGLLHRFLL